jgi:hypothetical protein
MLSSMARVRGSLCVVLAAVMGACTGGPVQPSGPASDPGSQAASGPSPSPEAASPVPSFTSPSAVPSLPNLRTAVQINPSIRARVGVPAEIGPSYWWTGDGDAGELGTTAQIGLPAGEQILSVVSGLIVSANRPEAGATDPTRLLIRDFATGALLREVETPISLPGVAVAGGLVFWGGTIFDPTGGDGVDGGFWALDPHGGGDPIAVVPGGEPVGIALGGRTRPVVSASGRTVAAGLIHLDGTVRTDFVEVPTLQVRHRDSGVPLATTDQVSISHDQGPTDAPYYGFGITARSIESGAVHSRFPPATDVDKFSLYSMVAVGSVILVKYYWQSEGTVESRVARIDPGSGKAQVLLQQDTLDPLKVYVDASSAGYLVLGGDSGGYLGDLIERGDTKLSIFDVSTGVLTRDAALVHTPFMRTSEGCRQDN